MSSADTLTQFCCDRLKKALCDALNIQLQVIVFSTTIHVMTLSCEPVLKHFTCLVKCKNNLFDKAINSDVYRI